MIHTIYVLGTLQLLNQPKERNFAIILMLMVTLKLLTENVGQGISFTADMIGGRVLYQAHLYGALTGLFLGAIVVVLKHLHRQKK